VIRELPVVPDIRTVPLRVICSVMVFSVRLFAVDTGLYIDSPVSMRGTLNLMNATIRVLWI
jgi:hypothetical protein